MYPQRVLKKVFFRIKEIERFVLSYSFIKVFSVISNVMMMMMMMNLMIILYCCYLNCVLDKKKFPHQQKELKDFFFLFGKSEELHKVTADKTVWAAFPSNERWQHIRGLSGKGFGSLSPEENFSHELKAIFILLLCLSSHLCISFFLQFTI